MLNFTNGKSGMPLGLRMKEGLGSEQVNTGKGGLIFELVKELGKISFLNQTKTGTYVLDIAIIGYRFWCQ